MEKKRLSKKIMACIMALCLVACLAGCTSTTTTTVTTDVTKTDDSGTVEEKTTKETQTQDGQTTVTESSEDQSVDDTSDTSDASDASDEEEESSEYDVESDDIGITYHLPESYIDAVGVVNYYETEVGENDGVFYAEMDYVGMSGDEYDELVNSDEISDEQSQYYSEHEVPLFMIMAITGNRSTKDLISIMSDDYGQTVSDNDLTLVASADGCDFYEYYPGEPSNYANLDGQYKTEYDNLVSCKEDILANATYTKPLTTFEKMVGQKISFTTTDFDGNTVTSDEIFGQNEITMVNVWATWCGWCVGELGDLEKINKRLASKNCAIVGLCGDSDDESSFKDAKSLISQNGVTYLNIRPFDGWEDVFDMNDGWPTSFFVDKNGVMITTPICGASVDKYEEHIDEALSGNTEHSVESKNSYANSDNLYRIKVVDESSDPVAGAMVQFCTDDTCKMAVTDSNGEATFNDPPGVYEVHVRKVPQGYKDNNNSYKTEDYYSDLVIVIDKG